MEVLFMRKQSTKTWLMILATALLLVWVGISCKSNNRPTEDGGLGLEKPADITNVVGDAKGLLSQSELGNWNTNMIHLRFFGQSEDGGYRRSPVIATFGGSSATEKHKIVAVMEMRYGRSGERDVAIDGNSLVQITYQYSHNSGNNFGPYDQPVGPDIGNDPANSRGAPVVFVGSDNSTVGVVAAAGGGMYGNSQLKIIKGTAGDSADTITWGDWADLKFADGELEKVTNESARSDPNTAILAYIKQKMDGTSLQGKGGNFTANAFYLKSGLGGVNGQNWVLAVTALDINISSHGNFGILVLYSEDAGATWKFGPYAKPKGGADTVPWWPNDTSSDYRESQVVAFDGSTVTIVAAPNTIHDSQPRQMYVFSGTYNTDAELTESRTGITEATGGIGLAQDTKDTSAYYLINTRKRVAQYNKILTIAKTTLDMQSETGTSALKMTGVSGVGSVAVLGDGTIVTVAEEAFAEGSTVGETKFNIVQRRFTPGYMENNVQVRDGERYYNPNYDIVDMDN